MVHDARGIPRAPAACVRAAPRGPLRVAASSMIVVERTIIRRPRSQPDSVHSANPSRRAYTSY